MLHIKKPTISPCTRAHQAREDNGFLESEPPCLCSYDSEDTAAPLYFTEKALGSRFFGSMRPEIVADLAAKPYARESHSHGLSLASFDANKVLKEEYEVLSLSTDPEGEARPRTAATAAGCLASS